MSHRAVDLGLGTGGRRPAGHRRADTGGFGYQPALDGLRAMAVVMVLLFHAGFGWMRGGYIGVSIFFTLSGFLITRVTVAEVHRSGRFSVAAFVSRRVRRLLPASLLCLAGIAVARSLGQFTSAPAFTRDVRAAMFSVFNWTRATGDRSYVDALAATGRYQSPVEHFWSLSIEEQYYLVWPLAIAGVVALAARTRGGFERSLTAVVAGATIVGVVAAPILAAIGGSKFAYWATPVRAVEILIGVCLALLAGGSPVGPTALRLSWSALAVLLAAAIWLPSGHGPAYGGWMAPIAVLSALLIRGVGTGSRLASVFSSAPIVAIGRISYGIYLYHWPVFVLARQHGWDLSSPLVFMVVTAVVFAIAALSFRLLEQPIRRVRAAPQLIVALAATALVVAYACVPLINSQRGFLEADKAALKQASAVNAPTNTARLVTSGSISPGQPTAPEGSATTSTAVIESATATTTATPETSTTSATTLAPSQADSFPTDLVVPPPTNRPVRILTIGDSTAFYVGQALAEWSNAHPDYMTSDLLWCQGCGFLLDGKIIGWDAAKFVRQSKEVLNQIVPDAIAKIKPDIVILMVTINDVANREWTADEGVLTPSDPLFAQRLTTAYSDVTNRLLELDVPRIVWIRPPAPNWRGDPPEMADPTRWVVMGDAIDNVARAAGARVSVMPLDQWARTTGLTDQPDWRPDGVHLTEASASPLIARWLAPWLLYRAVDADVVPAS